MRKHAFVLALLVGVSLLSACGQTANNTPAATRPARSVATSTSAPAQTVATSTSASAQAGATSTSAPAPAVATTTSAPAVAVATSTSAPARAAATPTSAPAAASTGSGIEAARLAETGKQVYQQQCQVCHGDQGQGIVGPALIGSRASPAKYGPTAKDLYTFIRTNMPQTTPGSLTADQYLAVTTYLLFQNELVSPTQRIDEGALQQIKTER